MLDAKNTVELTAPEVASVFVHGCSTVVRDQDPAGLNKLPDLLDFARAHGQRLRQDEHPIFVSRQLAFLDLTRTDKLVLQAKILDQLGPAVANACEMAATIPAAVQHPFPRILDVVQQPVDLHRGLGIMDGNSVVEPATANNELRYAFMEFLERIGVGQRRRSELPSLFVNE